MLTVIVILVAVALVWKFTPNPANKRAAGMMFQMLESFHIIDTTVNLDIFTQRLDLLSQLASTLPANAGKSKSADMALRAYSDKYNRPISPTSRQILNQPQIATSTKFRDEAATAFFLRSCNKLETEIKTLKTSNARQRRVTQAHELADIIVDRLYSDEQQKYIDCIHGELARLSGSTSLHPL